MHYMRYAHYMHCMHYMHYYPQAAGGGQALLPEASPLLSHPTFLETTLAEAPRVAIQVTHRAPTVRTAAPPQAIHRL